ncbi:unnamed protein product [Calicophoron daubneyi]|uniref:PH domain-containing protein n=1 Tax=Calicophoron daubneyi TaxID=300641 RepID=A0AAV2TM32_CALDB
MYKVPSICVENSAADSDDEVIQSHKSQPGWLSVPDVNYHSETLDEFVFDPQKYKEDLASYHLVKDSLVPGHLYITAKSKDRKTGLEHALVSVQIFRKGRPYCSRLTASKRECPTYALFFPCNQSHDVNYPTAICLNLAHSRVVRVDKKRFHIVTHSSDYSFLQAEVSDEGELNFWIDVFTRSDKNSKPLISAGQTSSAPNSPTRQWGSQCKGKLDSVVPFSAFHRSTEVLNDIMEAENE